MKKKSLVSYAENTKLLIQMTVFHRQNQAILLQHVIFCGIEVIFLCWRKPLEFKTSLDDKKTIDLHLVCTKL